jgi:hypothetical protein
MMCGKMVQNSMPVCMHSINASASIVVVVVVVAVAVAVAVAGTIPSAHSSKEDYGTVLVSLWMHILPVLHTN